MSILISGKSVNTVRKIVEEGETNNGIFSTPGKHRKGRPKKDLDDFDLCAIRQKVHFFYIVKKQVNIILCALLTFSLINQIKYNKYIKYILGAYT